MKTVIVTGSESGMGAAIVARCCKAVIGSLALIFQEKALK